LKAVVERRPIQTPAFDANDERYWAEPDLSREIQRAFQICADCRMCVTYCGSFPRLFDAVDEGDGIEAVTNEVVAQVSDQCWQCKLCYIKCPYTPDEGAYEALDFPRLMAREKAVRARRDGIAPVDVVLGEPDLIGRVGAGAVAPLANFVSKNRLVRRGVEKLAGVSSEFKLPKFASQTFASWWARHTPHADAGKQGEVVLFSTCYGNFNVPEVPRAAVQVLEANGLSVVYPEGQSCCGMPNLDGGDVARARSKMQHNIALLHPHAHAGRQVIAMGPTCGYTMKKEWPSYVGTLEAREVACKTVDFMEFMDGLRRRKRLNLAFERPLGKVAYHAACHLRAQKIGLPGVRVLAAVPETEVRVVERCSAVDGTWGMKAEYYAQGLRYAGRLLKELRPEPGERELLVGDCSLAGLRVEQHLEQPLLHPALALAKAYGFVL
jgi:glycerol-3-phosphate dehydrogenase subunit C